MDVDYKGFLAALGVRIKEFRKDRGWTLRDMVIQHGYHDSQWRKYESGGGLTIPSLLRIAALYKVSLTKLLDGLAEYPAEPLPEIKPKKSIGAAAERPKRIKSKG
jgi:transcriptional regulator with XRE-family HTH domain